MKNLITNIPAFFLTITTMAQSESDLPGEWKITMENQEQEWICKRTKPDAETYRDWGRFLNSKKMARIRNTPLPLAA